MIATQAGEEPRSWTDTAFSVGARRVTLSIEVLGPAEREAIAVSVAWLAAASSAPGDPTNAIIWETLVDRVLSAHVVLTVDHEEPQSLGRTWWHEVIRRTTSAFIRANALEDPISRSLSSMRPSATRPLLQ